MQPVRFLCILVLFLSVSACQKGSEPVEVTIVGQMRSIMFQNDISAKVFLKDLPRQENLYALGPLDYLSGEILVWDGTPLVATSDGDSVILQADWNVGAPMLVAAVVPEWTEVNLPNTVTTQRELEEFVAAFAKKRGLNPAQPFPFRLRGTARKLDWHVVNWPVSDTEHTHERHRTSGPHGTLTDTPVDVLGFFSTAHTGIFTHHDTDVHMHMKTADGRLMGHVDDLQPGQMTLSLPH